MSHLSNKAFPHCSFTYLSWVVFLCVPMVAWTSVLAQGFSPPDKLYFEHLGQAQGMPHAWIRSIIEDKEGFIWFATLEGLFKYDGYSATSFVANVADPLHSLQPRDVHEDHKGRLWVTSFGVGLHLVDKQTGKVIAYPIDVEQLNKWDQLETIYEDRQGILWLGTYQGIARFDPDTHIYTLYPTPNGEAIFRIQEDATGKLWSGSYRFDPKTSKFMLFPLPASFEDTLVSPLAFHIDAEGTAWMGSWEDGLFRIDTHKPEKYTLYNPKGLINQSIIGIYEADEFMWLGTSKGLQRVDKKTGQVLSYHSDPSQPGSLSSDLVGPGMYLDRSGNLWVGTSHGVNKASLLAKPFSAYQITPTSTSFHKYENQIFSVLEDHTGTIWVGSLYKGLYRLDTTTHQLIQVVVNPTDKRTMLNWEVWPLVEDLKGQLWVGTNSEKGLYQLDRASGKFIRYACQFPVCMLDKDASGKLWIGGWEEEIASFDPLTKRFTYYRADEKDTSSLLPGTINDLMVSRNGEVWVASYQGISRLNAKTGKFTRYQPNSRSKGLHLNDAYINALYEGQDGIIWIGTGHGGLNRFDPKTNTFTYFSTAQGLPSNIVESLMGDEKGNLWIGTNQGLSCFNPKKNTFRNFDMSDGLPGNQFAWKGSVYRGNKKLLFGNKDGLVVFYPDSIGIKRSPFPVYITSFKVFEENRPLRGDTIELAYNENFCSIDFVALNYASAEKTRYAYKLEGVDKQWVQAEKQRTARYTALAPGKYTFRVKASINNSVGNEKEDALQIIIHPPFWRTAWFYSLSALSFFGLLFLAIRYRIRQVRKEEQLLGQQERQQAEFHKKVSEMEMQALRAQMNPHFIFNCLNSINRFILKNEPEAASDYLAKFSRLIRLILQNSNAPTVTLENELEALRLYLEMEALRFDNAFTFRIHCEGEVEAEYVEIPPLIIQPYVENAIWHGFMHKQGEGHISIYVQQAEEMLLCTIEDDGVGRKRAEEVKSKSATKKKSLGMQLTAHRLELLNQMQDKQTRMEIVDLVDPQGEACGTRVVLQIPL